MDAVSKGNLGMYGLLSKAVSPLDDGLGKGTLFVGRQPSDCDRHERIGFTLAAATNGQRALLFPGGNERRIASGTDKAE
jgi:hypothetical protein